MRLVRTRAVVLVAVGLAGVVGVLLLVQRDVSCPAFWRDGDRVSISQYGADVTLGARRYRVSGSALLDHMPGGDPQHPVTITASVSASSREALGDPVFTCVRVARGGEVWARRPTTHATQTMADGYPPGAPSPVPNEAWRLATAGDGPRWQPGDEITLELGLRVDGHGYVLVLPSFPLMKGG